MSVVKPCIDDLLEKTDHNRFLLASLASKRACDINSMLRGQHNRVLAVQDVDDITIALLRRRHHLDGYGRDRRRRYLLRRGPLREGARP